MEGLRDVFVPCGWKLYVNDSICAGLVSFILRESPRPAVRVYKSSLALRDSIGKNKGESMTRLISD